MTGLADRLREDLRVALRERDRVRARVLRTTLSAIANAEAVQMTGESPISTVGDGPVAGAVSGLGAAEAERRLLSEDDLVRIVRDEHDERLAAATQIRDGGGNPVELLAEAELLAPYLNG